MFYDKRPRISITKSGFERTFEWIGLVVWIGWMVTLVKNWSLIPAKVPGHFGFTGDITRWGAKWELLMLPVLSGVLYIFLNWLGKHPEWHNYPLKITVDNAPFYYRLSRQLIAYLTTAIHCIFAWLSWDMIQIAKGFSSDLNEWFMPIFLIVILGPIFVYFYQMFRYQLKQKNSQP